MSSKDNGYEIVTEVGIFGSLNIEDPTVQPIKKKKKTIDEIILESTQVNLANFSNK